MTQKAQQLNDSGMDMRAVLKPTINIPWTKNSFHDTVWIPIQKAMFGTDSMKELSKDQVGQIADVIERELAEKHGLDQVPFPNNEEDDRLLIEALKIRPSYYPTDYEEPTI